MPQHLNAVVQALDEIAQTSLVWRAGLMNPGGPHRRLSDMSSPISIGDDECLAFGKVIRSFRPEHCFIVGTAFGFSSAYIAHTMRDNGGKSVVTLDNESEGDGVKCAAVASALTERLGLAGILHNKPGFSPRNTPEACEVAVHGLIFIDGLHTHPQVTRDFEALLPYSDERTLFVWHDFWMPGVPECIEVARARGLRCLWVPTSCEMVLGTRSPDMFAELVRLFPNGQENRAPHSKLQFYWLVSKWFLSLPVPLAVRTARDVLNGRGPHQPPVPNSSSPSA